LEFLFLSNFNLHVKLEDMQAYGDQLLTHALTQRTTLVEHLKITPPVKLATPTLDSKSTLIKKRKRDEITSTTQQKRRSEQLVDQAPHPKNMNGHIHSKIYTCQPHLERIMHYTQDC
jgi:hypothetical protein